MDYIVTYPEDPDSEIEEVKDKSRKKPRSITVPHGRGGRLRGTGKRPQVSKIAKFRQSCDNFCVQKLQETTFVCTIAIDNFFLHYFN